MSYQTDSDMRDSLEGYIWDAYKDVHGIRPRWINFAAMSIGELNDFADSLCSCIREQCERERRELAELEAAKQDPSQCVWTDEYGDELYGPRASGGRPESALAAALKAIL